MILFRNVRLWVYCPACISGEFSHTQKILPTIVFLWDVALECVRVGRCPLLDLAIENLLPGGSV